MLEQHSECHVAVNGREAVEAVKGSISAGRPYDLICLDIMMPIMDGQETLRAIRAVEAGAGIHGLDGVKVIMTTVLGDHDNVMESFREQCDGYLVKPIDKSKISCLLEQLELI
jgi:two-component system chemotaxis response regulator CheY